MNKVWPAELDTPQFLNVNEGASRLLHMKDLPNETAEGIMDRVKSPWKGHVSTLTGTAIIIMRSLTLVGSNEVFLLRDLCGCESMQLIGWCRITRPSGPSPALPGS